MTQVIDFAAFKKTQATPNKPTGPVKFLKPISKKAQKRADLALSVRLANRERL